MSPTYNHAYSIAFEVTGSTNPDGDDLTAEKIRAALMHRIENLDSAGDLEWLEAVGVPFDTFQE